MTRTRIATFSCLAVLTACLAIGTVADAVPDYGDTSPELLLAEFQAMLISAEADLEAVDRLLLIQEQYEADLEALYDETGNHIVSGALRHARVMVFQTRTTMSEIEDAIAELQAAIAELEAQIQPDDRNPPSISDAPEPDFQFQGSGSTSTVRASVSSVKSRLTDDQIAISDQGFTAAARCAPDRRNTAGTSANP